MLDVTGGTGPHRGQPILRSGTTLKTADGALILIHGRGAGAGDMIELAGFFSSRFACFAPQAAGYSWYPLRFTAPVADNEPFLSSGLAVLGTLVDDLLIAGLAQNRIALLGFSQGACLALEFARRREQRLGAVLGFSGGLIGDRIVRPALGSRPLEGVHVFLGCSAHDPHIPIDRVRDTKSVFEALGAPVEARIYPGEAHGINEDEIAAAQALLIRIGGRNVQAN